MWGQQVLVDSRPGAGGTVGAAFAAKSPADGYTLFQCNIASSAIAESLYARLPYDHQRDFAPISRIGTSASVLVVHPSLPARSVKEFIAYAKAHPGKLSYGTSAAGTSPQLSMELIKLTAQVDIVHIAYKGAPQALTDVIGGQIPVTMQTAPGALAAIQAGRVRALAVTSLKRLPQLPEVPTLHESALPGFEVTTWYGLCAPAGTPVAILDKVHADLTDGAAPAGDPAAALRYRGRSRADEQGGIRAVHPRGDRALGAGHQGCRHPAAVAPAAGRVLSGRS